MRMKNSLEQLGSFGPSRSPFGRKLAKCCRSVLCITTDEYFVRVLVMLLHARFSVVGPSYTFSIGRFFFSGHPYIGSTTVLPDFFDFF